MSPSQAYLCAGDVLDRPHGNCYWLAEGAVLAGQHPGAGGAVRLLQAGVTHFVDLTAPGEPVQAYDAAPARYSRHAITDFGIPGIDALHATLADIEATVAAGGLVYLHCRAGIGRTGTVAACLLVNQGLGGDEALALLLRKWQVVQKRVLAPHTPETEEQRRFVREFARERAMLKSASSPP
jgi:hypothetical protein